MNRLPSREHTSIFFRAPNLPPASPFRTCLSLLFLFSILLTSCGRTGTPPAPTPVETYPVDPLFQPLYDRLGGQARLGPAISPRFQGNGQDYQYTDAALMVYDPRLPVVERLHLAPLGNELGVEEKPLLPTENVPQTGEEYRLYPDFASLFVELGGEPVVGRPLGEAHRNAEMKRIEQYFENVGFYRLENDPTGKVGLLSYGAWKCDVSCRYSPPLNSAIQLPKKRALAFVKMVERLGVEFTGLALTEPFLASDGNLEQIYENVVLAADPKDSTRVFLRPIAGKLGLAPGPLSEPSSQPDMVFIPVQGEQGYHVPQEFITYLEGHGGLDVSGPPIAEPEQVDSGTLRQCFVNLCLERSQEEISKGATQAAPPSTTQPAESVSVHPTALGVTYRELYYRSETQNTKPELTGELSVQLWEGYPLVASDQEQEIGVIVLSNNAPLPNVSPVLSLTRPDGQVETFTLAPTGQNGETRVTIPPLAAQNGTLIPYQVCIDTQSSRKFCVLDSYLVWEAEYKTITPSVPPQRTLYLPFVFKEVKVYLPLVFKEFTIFIPIGFKNRSGD